MAKWDRNTPWRQGHFLEADAVAAFGLTCDDGCGPAAVVVISHDCDLAQSSDVEPTVEVMVGRVIDGAANGNYTHCKNPRRLHVDCTAGRSPCVVELDTARRHFVAKESVDETLPSLAGYVPNTLLRMAGKERNILQLWLAARYRRSAFPDEFDRRLKEETGVAERLANVFKDSGRHVAAVFFDIDEGLENKREGPNDAYELLVTLLYSTDQDPGAAEAAANAAARRVEEIFRGRCELKRDDGQTEWQWIELLGVEIVSAQALSYADSLQLTKWHADHVSLRTHPAQPMIET